MAELPLRRRILSPRNIAQIFATRETSTRSPKKARKQETCKRKKLNATHLRPAHQTDCTTCFHIVSHPFSDRQTISTLFFNDSAVDGTMGILSTSLHNQESQSTVSPSGTKDGAGRPDDRIGLGWFSGDGGSEKAHPGSQRAEGLPVWLLRLHLVLYSCCVPSERHERVNL